MTLNPKEGRRKEMAQNYLKNWVKLKLFKKLKFENWSFEKWSFENWNFEKLFENEILKN